MPCSCEEILEQENPILNFNEKLTYLGRRDYQDGMVCGEFDVKYIYKCLKCGVIYIQEVCDGNQVSLYKSSE